MANFNIGMDDPAGKYRIVIDGVSSDPSARRAALGILSKALGIPPERVERALCGGGIRVSGEYDLGRATRLLDQMASRGISAHLERVGEAPQAAEAKPEEPPPKASFEAGRNAKLVRIAVFCAAAVAFLASAGFVRTPVLWVFTLALFALPAAIAALATKIKCELSDGRIAISDPLATCSYRLEDVRLVGIRDDHPAGKLLGQRWGRLLVIAFADGTVRRFPLALLEGGERLRDLLARHCIFALPEYDPSVDREAAEGFDESWHRRVAEERRAKELPATDAPPTLIDWRTEDRLEGFSKLLALPLLPFARRRGKLGRALLFALCASAVFAVLAYPALTNPLPQAVTVEDVLGWTKPQKRFVALLDGWHDTERATTSERLGAAKKSYVLLPVVSPSDPVFRRLVDEYKALREATDDQKDSVLARIESLKPSRYLILWIPNFPTGSRRSDSILVQSKGERYFVAARDVSVGIVKETTEREKSYFASSYGLSSPRWRILVGASPSKAAVPPFYAALILLLWGTVAAAVAATRGPITAVETFEIEQPPPEEQPPQPTQDQTG